VQDALETNEHGGLKLGQAARSFLRGEQEVSIVMPPPKGRRNRKGAEANPVDDPLFEALRACRRDLAREAGVPPYVIFHDSSLRDMAEKRPRNDDDLSHVSGVGVRKREAYGRAFLDVIARFEGA
jgi:ATP-dependent DNA helicase RecQ